MADSPIDPEFALKHYYAALNDRDVDAAFAQFADDAVRIEMAQPGAPIVITGKAHIQAGIRARVADNVHVEARDFQVTEDKVTCIARVVTDYWRRQGRSAIEEAVEVVIQEGKIKTFTVHLVEEIS